MNVPECLTESLRLRIPTFESQIPPSARLRELEDYLLESAYKQGDLTEERFGWMQKLVPLEYEWSHLNGWEALKQTKTEKGVIDAKRRVNPKLYDDIQECHWVIKRLSEEIDRLERDANKCSRVMGFLGA